MVARTENGVPTRKSVVVLAGWLHPEHTFLSWPTEQQPVTPREERPSDSPPPRGVQAGSWPVAPQPPIHRQRRPEPKHPKIAPQTAARASAIRHTAKTLVLSRCPQWPAFPPREEPCDESSRDARPAPCARRSPGCAG